jgi:hypothetical protein
MGFQHHAPAALPVGKFWHSLYGSFILIIFIRFVKEV